jgi:hypothetical protein
MPEGRYEWLVRRAESQPWRTSERDCSQVLPLLRAFQSLRKRLSKELSQSDVSGNSIRAPYP